MLTIPAARTCFRTRLKTAALAAAMLVLGGTAVAQQQDAPASSWLDPDRISLAALEDAFWACDYGATTRGAGDDAITPCEAVYDALKERKFGGDFDRLLAWWEEHKPAQFARLDHVGHPLR